MFFVSVIFSHHKLSSFDGRARIFQCRGLILMMAFAFKSIIGSKNSNKSHNREWGIEIFSKEYENAQMRPLKDKRVGPEVALDKALHRLVCHLKIV